MNSESMYSVDGGDKTSELSKTKFDYVCVDDAPYRFDSLTDEAKAYLETNGYVVIANVLSSNDLEKAIELLWKFLKAANWQRDDLSSWKDFPGHENGGVIYKNGIGQSEMQWYIRTCPKVLEIFSQLWNVKTTELITSFDGVGIFRPYNKNPDWKTKGQWFHVDQNPKTTPNLDCYQGLITLYDQNEYSGGTVVIPKTHTLNQEIFKNIPDKKKHFNLIPDNHSILNEQKLLICTKAGDLVLWDSRTIHCNTPALIELLSDNLLQSSKDDKITEKETNDEKLNHNDDDNNENKNKNKYVNKKKDFVRLVSYVCMTPKSKADEITLEKRKLAYQKFETTTHIPHEFYLASSPDSKIFGEQSLDNMSAIMQSLIGI